ncbi:MAG: peptidoglycan-associated lipoprotein Pal [candidate division KSB1 bacterium]|nr:peptidoglycan-associated lipoprotein Pal [candidate division KSB1 bacterium]MDZ7275274.1 peptidoglycan-associated lipoprotein Pal [candidate division KSB1 bacterium]MDZ7287442.1 peptidoglycan-associated lipoprotein Pal [candidate division KSB1 bacterium]MDZ7299556.1 peptidoglycan-associated lipoprotein Pal [candidate division KSB1 bacterium]MDZ7308014.1 peptidoglycan-associated lipoprotein Pal [candidate division KSB1 bacterium]
MLSRLYKFGWLPALSTLLLPLLLMSHLGCSSGRQVVKQSEAAPPEPVREETPPPPPPARQPAVEREDVPAPRPLMLANVHFDYDKYDLTATAREILAAHARALRERPELNVRIAGHCDERGTIEYNLALGEKRANAVRDYLVSLGVERSRLSTISYGKERPLDARSNEEAWAKNRRAEFVILNQ